MIAVIDASVAIKWFVREAGHQHALGLLDRGDELHAPDLIVAEVANTAWKKYRRGEIGREQAEAIVTALPHYFARLWPSRELAEAALALALDLDHPAYDGFYIACTKASGGMLISADRRLCDVAGKKFAQWLGSDLP